MSQVFQLDFLFPAKMVSHLKLAKNVNFEKNVLSIFSKTVKMVFDKFEKISRPHKIEKKSDCKKREQALLTLKKEYIF